MHQQSRHPPRVSSPASSPQTNPIRTNNPRENIGGHLRTGSEATSRQEATGTPESGEASSSSGPSRESIKKLDQIVQNFHLKAAVVILQSRINTTPSAGSKKSDGKKVNKWFQLETDDIDGFRDELRTWKTCGSFENRPPPLIIETYLDASRLSPSQSLVIVDDNGKRWDVVEALNNSESSSDDSSPRMRKRNTEVILERWRIELRTPTNESNEDFGATLPTIYKRSIVFFRSLFVATRFMPAWKFSQQAMTKSSHPSLEVRCRILTSETDAHGYDPLRQPLYDGREVVTDYLFGDLEVPVGRFLASVSYRNDCNFRVDDSEALLSSRFMGVDENYFRPSLPQRAEGGRRDSYAEVGSLPAHRHGKGLQDQQQTYGSLSTFHGAGPLGTSPISALKAVKPIGSDTSSPPESAPASVEPDPPHSMPISGHSSRRSLRSLEGMGRRPSVSFQPFKAGSLSGSPRIPDVDAPSSPQSIQRPSGLSALAQARNRNSLTAGMAASLRGGPPAGEIPMASSPKPTVTSRYSSSFTHRRGRPSFGGTSKTGDDDQVSSGKQSLSSSVAQPGSGLLAEAGGASSGSFQTDDDSISDFLKVLDSRKTLQSFEPNKKGESATKRTVAQLSKFQLMRESNNALTESMTSSMHLHRSSSSSSRQLASVPGMVAPASISAGSSPGKPLSPHTPHTPAIPSRLSENSIIDYQAQAQAARRAARATAEAATTEEEGSDGVQAIDIPLSPRLLQTNRRSSSVAQQHRSLIDDEDTDLPYTTHRSISLGADEREPPTLSTLLNMERDSGGETPALQPPADIRASAAPRSSSSAEQDKNPPSGLLSAPSSSSPYRLRYQSNRGRPTPPQSSRGSFVGSSSGRYPLNRGENEADEEPLLFELSELGRELGRRSLEEGRGGGSAGSGSAERGGFESRGSKRGGW